MSYPIRINEIVKDRVKNSRCEIQICLRPKQVAEHHSDEHCQDVRASGEPPHERTHPIAHRVSARSEGDCLFEHQEKRDSDPGGRDQGEDRLRREVHCCPPDGDVLPLAGPHRKCPRRMPTTTATMNAHAGWSWTAGRM